MEDLDMNRCENISAFPEVRGHSNGIYTQGGMTLRDWFASMAMSGHMGKSGVTIPADAGVFYAIADDMIAARNGEKA